MKKFFNILFKIGIVIVLGLLAIALFVYSVTSQKVPDIYVAYQNAEALAVKGNYTWNAFSEVIREEDADYSFKSDNTILITPGEELSLYTSSNAATRLDFEVVSMYYYDRDSNRFEGEYYKSDDATINTYSNRSVAKIKMPDKEDTYFYYFTLSYFEKGTVDYAIKAVVSTEPTYDIAELQNYRRTSLLDKESIDELLRLLPYSKNITNTTVQANTTPTRITINYSEIVVGRSGFNNNSIALFALIPELDIVEYKSPNDYFYFTRDELELIQKRDLTDYALNIELWETEILYKEPVETQRIQLCNIISGLIEESLPIPSGERLPMLAIDTSSFENSDEINFDSLSSRIMLSNLSNYCEQIYDIDLNTYERLMLSDPFVMFENRQAQEEESGDNDLESGDNDIIDPNIHNIKFYVIINKRITTKSYRLLYLNNGWEVYEN